MLVPLPLQSPSWGAFPRPKDMSKAFGGGRIVPLGEWSGDGMGGRAG